MILTVPPSEKVDAEIVNGLLTASSIVFGFLILLAQPHLRRESFRRVVVFIVVPFLVLVFAATQVFFSGLSPTALIWALYGSMASFLTNAISVVILLAAYHTRALENAEELNTEGEETEKSEDTREEYENLIERDKEILSQVAKAYDFQFDLREKLDGKLNNFIAITAAIATLNTGIGFFVFDKIATRNPFHLHLVLSFLIGMGFFVFAMLRGLLGYKPMSLTYYLEDSERFIKKYKKLTQTHVVREVAASLACATNLRKEVNARKAETINWVFWLVIFGFSSLLIFSIFMVIALGVPPPIDP